MFCIAFLVHVFVGAPLASFLAPRLSGRRFGGFAHGAATTALNVCTTSPVTNLIATALFVNPDDFATAYVAALSTTMPMTMLASFFVVGPAVKLVFHNRISPVGGLRALQAMEQHAPSISRMLGA